MLALWLGGCATVDPAAQRTGLVVGVYTETAPGLLIESALSGDIMHASRWAEVELTPAGPFTTARIEPGLNLRRGDMVRLQLQDTRARNTDALRPVGHRVVGVLALDLPAVAAIPDR